MLAMVKAKPNGTTLMYPAMTAYKQWVWKEIRRLDWVQQNLVDEMKRVGRAELLAIPNPRGSTMYDTLSTSTITNLIGAEDGVPPSSNCSFMHVINKALRIAPPPVCDPGSALSQIKDRLDDRWRQMTEPERERFLKAMESILGLTEPR